MCNPNNSCNKIAPAKLEQFNLTITDWCVRIYLLLAVYTLDLGLLPRTGVTWVQPVTVLPNSVTRDNSTSVNTYCI